MKRNRKPSSSKSKGVTRTSADPKLRKETSKACTNDPGWYASDPAILRDAASIPFSWALGTTINRGGEGTIKFGDAKAIPGIMRVSLTPVMGLSITADSALNTASTAMYSYVRHANSGHANYAAPDLMLYCGAMAQVYSYINWCQRLYGCATMYAQKNRYIPRHLLISMGVDADNIANNLANFRYWINVMVAKASSLAVPATMSYFSRTAFLYSNIYCESDQIKDQLYYFHPAAWLKFKFDSSTQAGMLESVALTPAKTLLTLPEIQKFGEELLGVVLQDEDMNIMSGDILKAYGTDNIIKLAPIPEYLPIFPIYDPMVLEQIHNATIVAIDRTNVEQDPDKGYLTCIPTITDSKTTDILAITMNKLLSCDKPEPGVEDVIESTRLMLGGDSSRTSGSYWYVGCGTEVVNSVVVYTLTATGSLENQGYVTVTANTNNTALSKLKAFKYAPTHVVVNGEQVQAVFESIDNYAVLNPQDVYKMHDVALMNMFAVPSVAKVNNV